MKKLALLLLAALLALSGCAAAENLCVDFFDVGKADAMLITTPAGERILIDAATHKQGGKLVGRRKVLHRACRLLCRLRHEGHRRVDGYGTQKPEADDRP